MYYRVTFIWLSYLDDTSDPLSWDISNVETEALPEGVGAVSSRFGGSLWLERKGPDCIHVSVTLEATSEYDAYGKAQLRHADLTRMVMAEVKVSSAA